MTAARQDRLVGLSPEDRVLLECCRVQINAADVERIGRVVSGPLDWNGVLRSSIRHGVAPLLKHGLDQIEALSAGVPRSVVDALAVLQAGSERRNRRLFDALAEIVAALRAGGVDPVGLKEIRLAVEVYPQRGLRPMGDIDLLVRRQDWHAAAASLSGLGFLALPSADVPYTRTYAPAQHFRRAGDDIWIDLQWNVMEREWDRCGEGRFTYDGLGMWQRARPMAIDGYELRVPVLEDLLFHLCVHLEGHTYSELVLFTDVAELLRSRGAELRWDAFVEITRSCHAESSVYYVLLLTQRLLDAPVAEDVLSELEPGYFHGGLLGPLFANLTALHLSLDDIRISVAAPRPVMDELERVARRQTARSLRLDAELDRLAMTFRDRGGKLVIFDGSPSLRLFPDHSVPAFEPIHMYVLEEDASLVGEPLGASPVMLIETRDPVLAEEQFWLKLMVKRSDGLSEALTSSAPAPTNARSAWRSLRDRLTGPRDDDRNATAQVVLHALAAEELVVLFAAKLGSADEHRLFAACGLLEVLRGLRGEFDEDRISELAAAHGVLQAVSAGLSIVSSVASDVPRFPPGAGLGVPPRILEWARYGPSSLKRYPWLRGAYYFVFALLATQGARPRLRYLRRSVLADGAPGMLPRLAGEVARGLVRQREASEPSFLDLAHWLEPETASLLESRLELSL